MPKKNKKVERKYARQRARRGYCDRDIWSIDYWFMDVMPKMLKQLKETRHGSPAMLGENYVNDKGFTVNDKCHEEWDKILDRMIFLLGEMNEDTCKKENPYYEEWAKAQDEFSKEYGFMGQGLITEEEKAELPKGYSRWHTMGELPQYKEISENFFKAERERDQYRDDCKNEFFELFSKYFWDLWD